MIKKVCNHNSKGEICRAQNNHHRNSFLKEIILFGFPQSLVVEIKVMTYSNQYKQPLHITQCDSLDPEQINIDLNCNWEIADKPGFPVMTFLMLLLTLTVLRWNS